MRQPGAATATLGALATLGILLAGCGSSGAQDTATQTSAAPSTSAAAGDRSTAPAASASAPAAEPTAEPSADSAIPAADKNQALVDAARAGGAPAVCTFAKDDTQGVMTIRGEDSFRFEGSSPNGPIQMLRAEDMLYVWQPGATQGLSTEAGAPGADGPISPSGLADEVDAGSLHCEPYAGEQSVFGVPDGVQFVSLEALNNAAGN